MSGLEQVVVAGLMLLAFLAGLAIGVVAECLQVRAAERLLCVTLPEDVTS